MTGTLYGLGLGPGDPELITLKAARLIGSSPVIAYPVANGELSLARRIAAGLIPEGAVELPFDLPMRAARDPAQAAYDAAAERLAQPLAEGRDVALLCEGDPLFYGSFMYLMARLSSRFPVQVVPGVTSVSAAAAAAARPLVARSETLAVLAATLDDAALTDRLAGAEAAAILKLGRHFGRVRALLDRLGLAARALYVARASQAEQHVCPLAEAPLDAPYFAMILIPGKDAHAAPPY